MRHVVMFNKQFGEPVFLQQKLNGKGGVPEKYMCLQISWPPTKWFVYFKLGSNPSTSVLANDGLLWTTPIPFPQLPIKLISSSICFRQELALLFNNYDTFGS